MDEWKKIQQNTFTRWTNEHLKTVDSSIDDLETDLADGLRLIALIEVLSQKQLPRHNKNPKFRSQQLENVSVALEFLQDEGIKIVNIDSSDIVDCKLKLILGLIWTLILHYSISMPKWEEEEEEEQPSTAGLTPKQRLLNWIQIKIPDMHIHNFTTDWSTGLAVGALVDGCASGLCPDWDLWDPNDPVRNATEAMDLAEEWLDVRQLIRPEELVNPNVDEQSMMTYLAQFPFTKLKPGAPLRPKTDPNRVCVFGPGIEPIGILVGESTHFTIATFSTSSGFADVEILCPCGEVDKPAVNLSEDNNLTYTVAYTPKEAGLHKITIRYLGDLIPDSVFPVMVGNPVSEVIVEPVEGGAEVIEQPEYVPPETPEYVPPEQPEYVPPPQPEYVPPPQPEYVPPPQPEYVLPPQPMDELVALALVDNGAEISELEEGMCFAFSGRIGDHCKSFEINFLYRNDTDDIALHINPRLRTKAIVRNTRVNGRWGREELYLSHPFMFRKGDRFEIRVLVTADWYLIAINGHHFAQYLHRQPYGAVRFVQINGDLSEVEIHRSRVRGYPNSLVELEASSEGYFSLPLNDNMVEVGQLCEGLSFIFSGNIAVNCNVFSVNFLLNNEKQDIALTIVTRIAQKAIVRNSKIKNKWGREEGSSALPFLLSRSGRFTIQVLVTDGFYLISINGHHFTPYSHRLPFSAVRALSFDGDVENVQIHRTMVHGYPHRLSMLRSHFNGDRW